MADKDMALREHLVYLLRDGGAHVKFDDVVADFPVAARSRKVKNFPHTAWMLLEHMRLAQWDILEFSGIRSMCLPRGPTDTGQRPPRRRVPRRGPRA